MRKAILFLAVTVFFSAADFVTAQSRSKTRKKSAATTTAAKNSSRTNAPEQTENLPTAPPKKNERAATEIGRPDENVFNEQDRAPKKANRQSTTAAAPQKNADAATVAPMPYFYEFTQPDFTVSRVVIEHDTNGKGKITFVKRGWSESITDPLEISPVALEKIKNLYKELNFLDSNEDYQSKQYHYPHLGVMKLRIDENGKQRETTFNWTDNKTAENLTKEYKRLTEQYVWMFDINLARENQPLESPKIVERLASLFKRNEISDTAQMLPFLRELADDERIPLIARNHVARIIKQIEKTQ